MKKVSPNLFDGVEGVGSHPFKVNIKSFMLIEEVSLKYLIIFICFNKTINLVCVAMNGSVILIAHSLFLATQNLRRS